MNNKYRIRSIYKPFMKNEVRVHFVCALDENAQTGFTRIYDPDINPLEYLKWKIFEENNSGTRILEIEIERDKIP